MAYIGNTPGTSTVLRVEARKSFALGVHITDPSGKPANLSGCTLSIVAKKYPIDSTGDVSNLLAANSIAVLTPLEGYGQFNIQASTLDQKPGEYDYAIVLRTQDGYSSVIVKGLLVIEQNAEVSSVSMQYGLTQPPQSLTVQLLRQNSIKVFVGGQLPPGMNYVRDDVVAAIESFDPDAVAYVPEGGDPGYVLTKTGNGDYTMAWLPVGNGAFALDATGRAAGEVPVALGDDTWIWGAVGIDATGVTAGWAPVANGDGTWSWAKVSQTKPSWTAPDGSDAEILNKPSLGTMAAQDTSTFLQKTELLSVLNTVHVVSTVPTTGANGHLYFVYQV